MKNKATNIFKIKMNFLKKKFLQDKDLLLKKYKKINNQQKIIKIILIIKIKWNFFSKIKILI
jgi:hypothetical protein